MATATGKPPDLQEQPAHSTDNPAQRYRDAADKVRGRVDAFGDTLRALGTAAVTGIGIARIDDLSPVQPDAWWLVVIALITFAIGAGTSCG